MLRRILIPTINRNLGRLASTTATSSKPAEGTTGNLVVLDVNDKTGYATITLNRAPVNSLNLDLLKDLSKALDYALDNRSRGVILASSAKTVFSAGLDITEMYKPKPDRVREFWTALQDVWLKLYGSPFPTAAAISGHSPAGGCLLALSCEFRVMCPNYTIGLNETQLGIVAPSWFQVSLSNVIPRRTAELALTTGKMFSTDEALKVGIIDDVALDKNDAIAKCEAFLNRFKKIPSSARSASKQMFRSKDIQELENNREQDLQLFLRTVMEPKIQEGLEVYLDSLKSRK
jgi:3,2-trans-enoyl-CoA isomerase